MKGENKMKQTQTQKLADAIREAALAAIAKGKEYENNDGGSCNLDTPMVLVPRGIKTRNVVDTQGRQLLGCGYGGGYYSVRVPLWGQGYQRTAMAEAARDRLCELGYTSYVRYVMD